MRFLWLDVETTGLDPSRDLLLEVACWPSRSADPFDLHEDDKRSWVIRHTGADLGRCLVPATWKMHGPSGLLGKVVESQCSLGGVERLLMDVVTTAVLGADGKPYVPGPWHLAGNSVHFDRGFLNYHMPEFARLLHHRILDVSSLALVARHACGMPWEKGEPVHRALADVEASIKQARQITRWFKNQPLKGVV